MKDIQQHSGGASSPSLPAQQPSESLQRFKKIFHEMPKFSTPFSMAAIARDVLNKERDKDKDSNA
jgi:hypothetical protein